MGGRASMTRPSVNINFHHLADLLGCDFAEVRPMLEERFGFGAAVLTSVERLREVTRDRTHMTAVGDASGAMLQSYLATVAVSRADSFIDVNGALQPVFAARDAAILDGFEAWCATESSTSPLVWGVDIVDIPDRVDLSVFGDWGTGTPAAERVAASIVASGPSVRVHLGDVYYSGTVAESASYLVERWPGSGSLIGRACNSNHEMYSGGQGYRARTLPALRQGSPTFVLRNRSWLLIGLDTGTVNARVSAGQVQSLLEIVEASGTRNVILMSHHPWFSWTEGQNRELRKDVEPLLSTGRVRAWYSAHDHGFVRFDRDVEFGIHLVCAGHGGFPYGNVPGDGVSKRTSGALRLESVPPLAGNPGGLGLFGPSGLGHLPEEYGPCGWVRLALDGPQAVEHVMDEDGHAHFAQVVHDTHR